MRLTLEMKSMLERYITKEVIDDKTLKPLNEEKSKLLEKFEYVVRKKYDQKDMLVFKKYNKASTVGEYYTTYRKRDCYQSIHISCSHKTLVPTNYYVASYSYDMGNDIEESVVADCARLQADHDIANKVMRAPYRKLIESCNTVNQLADVWPEVKNAFPQWFEPKKSTALIALSKEDLAWIRADSARRVAKKAKDK